MEERTAQGQLRVFRCYLVGQRFYMLFTAGEPMQWGSPFQPTNDPGGQPQRTASMAQFLKSFQLLDSQGE